MVYRLRKQPFCSWRELLCNPTINPLLLSLLYPIHRLSNLCGPTLKTPFSSHVAPYHQTFLPPGLLRCDFLCLECSLPTLGRACSLSLKPQLESISSKQATLLLYRSYRSPWSLGPFLHLMTPNRFSIYVFVLFHPSPMPDIEMPEWRNQFCFINIKPATATVPSNKMCLINT